MKEENVDEIIVVEDDEEPLEIDYVKKGVQLNPNHFSYQGYSYSINRRSHTLKKNQIYYGFYRCKYRQSKPAGCNCALTVTTEFNVFQISYSPLKDEQDIEFVEVDSKIIPHVVSVKINGTHTCAIKGGVNVINDILDASFEMKTLVEQISLDDVTKSSIVISVDFMRMMNDKYKGILNSMHIHY